MSNVMETAIVTDNSVTIVVDGNTRAVNKSHPNYAAIREAVRSKNWSSIPSLLDVRKSVSDFMQNSAGTSKVSVESEYGRLVVKYNGLEVNNYITRRILALMNEGFDAVPIIRFFENVKLNPSKRAVDDLFEFIERGNIPLTPDGHILAYKNVRADFKDIHSGTMDNSVGCVVEMPRNEVNEDPDQTCSSGLHFCSQEYLPNFTSANGHTVIVKVHPRDVVAFPRDYNLSKVRCCRYEVVAVHEGGSHVSAFDKTVDDRWSDNDPGMLDDEPDEQDDIVENLQKALDEIKSSGHKTNFPFILSLKDAAEYFGCSESAVRKRCQRGASARWAGYNKVEILESSNVPKIGPGSVVSVAEAAAYFGCSENAVRKRCDRRVSARWAGYLKVAILA